MSRISRDEMFLRMAHVVALRGTCNRAQVGALITLNNRVISMGYNGSRPGEPHCDDVGHLLVDGHCIRTVHAEVNALEFVRKYLANEIPTRSLEMYVTHQPCLVCCRELVSARMEGIQVSRVVFDKTYNESDLSSAWSMLEKGGIELVQYSL